MNAPPDDVIARGGGPYGRCFDNVERAVQRHGGDIVCGWSAGPLSMPRGTMVNRFGSIGLVAHALWRDAGGRLIEITDGMEGKRFWADDAVMAPSKLGVCFADDERTAAVFAGRGDDVHRRIIPVDSF